MKTIENNNGNARKNGIGYMCNSAEFTRETDKADGASLMVVDENSHKVTGIYVAYNGYWNDFE